MHNSKVKAVVKQEHKGVTVARQLWVRSPLEGINYYLLLFSFLRSGAKVKDQFSSVTQHT